MSKTNTTTPVRVTVRQISIQLYSLLAWLLILSGGMLAVGSLFANLTMAQIVSSVLVGFVTIISGIGMTRLLNRDIRQTAPILWF